MSCGCANNVFGFGSVKKNKKNKKMRKTKKSKSGSRKSMKRRGSKRVSKRRSFGKRHSRKRSGFGLRRSRRRGFGQSGPGFKAPTTYPNVYAPYFGSSEPFVNPSGWFLPVTGGKVQSPDMLMKNPIN